MALTYDKVLNVIRQPPDLRKDFEINNLLPWFRKKSNLFTNLKTELLFDIIKHLQFISRVKDELLIKQGERGDCMYILLRGKVTIFILYNKTETEEDKASQPVITAKGGDALRQQLGTFVTHLGVGATFGEVALLKEDDCIRTASIITEEPSDLIVVNRELYNRSVKDVLKKEFEDKTNFVVSNPYTSNWAPKYKKQLTMALMNDVLPYEAVLTKQGDKREAIYFIRSGEVKVVMEPHIHEMQYPKLFDRDTSVLPMNDNNHNKQQETVQELLRAKSADSTEPVSPYKFRKKRPKRLKQEICLLGVNESIGDIETLLDLDTFMQTSICTQRTDVLVLEMKHWERLFVKRNPRAIESMKEELEVRLKTRITKHLEKSVPLLKVLSSKAEDYNLQRQQQSETRHSLAQEKQTKQRKTMAEAYDSFVPQRGALVDMYGPGTVFYRIREREKARQLKLQKRQKLFGGVGFNSLAPASVGQGTSSRQSRSGDYRSASRKPTDQYDPALSNLENKMRAWLTNDPAPDTAPQAKSAPRVATLHRARTEVEQLKPGAKVVIRQRTTFMTGEKAPFSAAEFEEDDFVHHGSSYRKAQKDVK